MDPRACTCHRVRLKRPLWYGSSGGSSSALPFHRGGSGERGGTYEWGGASMGAVCLAVCPRHAAFVRLNRERRVYARSSRASLVGELYGIRRLRADPSWRAAYCVTRQAYTNGTYSSTSTGSPGVPVEQSMDTRVSLSSSAQKSQSEPARRFRKRAVFEQGCQARPRGRC